MCGEGWREMNGRKRNMEKKWREAGRKYVQRKGRVK